MHSHKDIYGCNIGEHNDECGSTEERAKQNTGHELEVQNEDL